MGWLVVRNITNTKKPHKKKTSALAEIQRKRRYFFVLNGFFKLSNILWWYTNIRDRYIYGYFSRLWTDFDQTKMI